MTFGELKIGTMFTFAPLNLDIRRKASETEHEDGRIPPMSRRREGCSPGWPVYPLAKDESEDEPVDVELIDIEIPDEFVALCADWHSGQNDMLYAVASTGNLTLGSIRPYSTDVGRHLTDAEWQVSLFKSLSCDVMHAKRSAYKAGHDDAETLDRFEQWADDTIDRLVTAYGLEDSDAV